MSSRVPEVFPQGLADRPTHPRRGVPVPAFADRSFADPPGDGYDFNRSDRALYGRFADNRWCPICGEVVRPTEDMYFVMDEQALIRRHYPEGFGHEGCVLAALRLCPFIFKQEFKRASEQRLGHARNLDDDEKPVVWVMISSRYYKVDRSSGSPVVRPKAPRNHRFFGYEDGDLVEVSLDEANELLRSADLEVIPDSALS